MKKRKTKRKVNRRSKIKYPALDPEYNIKIRHEVIDYDYIDKLDEKHKEYLNQFSKEYINAAVGRQKDKGKNNRFHKTKKEIQDCQKRNNDRNACIYGKAKAMNRLTELSIEDLNEIIDPENYYNSFLDFKKKYDIETEEEFVEILEYLEELQNES